MDLKKEIDLFLSSSYTQWEVVVVQLSADDFIGRLADCFGDLRIESELFIDGCGGLFQDAKGLDDRERHSLGSAIPNGKVLDGAQGLGTIVFLLGHLKLT